MDSEGGTAPHRLLPGKERPERCSREPENQKERRGTLDTENGTPTEGPRTPCSKASTWWYHGAIIQRSTNTRPSPIIPPEGGRKGDKGGFPIVATGTLHDEGSCENPGREGGDQQGIRPLGHRLNATVKGANSTGNQPQGSSTGRHGATPDGDERRTTAPPLQGGQSTSPEELSSTLGYAATFTRA